MTTTAILIAIGLIAFTVVVCLAYSEQLDRMDRAGDEWEDWDDWYAEEARHDQ